MKLPNNTQTITNVATSYRGVVIQKCSRTKGKLSTRSLRSINIGPIRGSRGATRPYVDSGSPRVSEGQIVLPAVRALGTNGSWAEKRSSSGTRLGERCGGCPLLPQRRIGRHPGSSAPAWVQLRVLETILDNQGQQYPTNKDRQKLTPYYRFFLGQCSHVVT